MADPQVARPNNLPIQLTSFIGREREIAQVRGFLSTTRLLTLTGAGGAGKSRLAFQVAAEALEDFTNGVWVVELASITDPALVAQAVASVLSVSEEPTRPLTDTLQDYLRPRSLLLILDNCEHLRAACAQLATALLHECPNLRILVTSRIALGVPGETLWRAPSLSLPDPGRLPSLDQVPQYEAVRLFVERARAGQQLFALTAENAPAVVKICHRLDGMPLAIELAAARTRVLSVEQIAARLDDRFRLLTGGSSSALPRHQTLHATMEWSYGLLSEKERKVFRRLSVFAGGWTLVPAEVICSGDGLESGEILDLLAQLVDKSLVTMETRGGEARYRLLETVRQYSRDRLQEAGETDHVRRRHRDLYLELAEEGDAGLRGAHEGAWLRRLEVEHDNLRAALDWSKVEECGAEAELRLVRALEWFWHLLGNWSEGRTRLEEAIRRSSDQSRYLPKALVGAARLAYRQGDRGRARVLCETGLALARALGDGGATACFLLWLGILAMAEADHARAMPLLDHSLTIYREIGDQWWTVEALSFLGTAAMEQHDYGKAAALYQESLAVSRETGNTNNIATALRNIGHLALRLGDHDRAEACYLETLLLYRHARAPGVITECLDGLARVASLRVAYERAARLFGAVEASLETLGGQLPLWSDISEHDRYVTATRAKWGDAAAFATAWGEGRAMALEQAIEYALGSAVEKIERSTTAGLLTPREREVAALVARGLTNRQIAAKLVVTERTAETHVQNIFNKLGFTSRAQVAAWTVEQGLRAPAEP